jgi:cation diffusion facilitator CzcD-associated flavoprotein CzcO/amino acid transporter
MDEALRAAARLYETGKPRRVLSTRRIVFLVVAAAAPLAAMIGTLPIALAQGNGAGMPGAFLVAAAILLCFSVGYARISRRVVSTGAFYTYVVQGLGRVVGVGAALVAAVSYVLFAIGAAVAFGYFANLLMSQLGVSEPWFVWGAVGAALTGVLGYRSIDLSSRVLGALMMLEIAILGAFDGAVIIAKGWDAFPLASFTPHVVFAHGFAIAMTFAFTAFIGFESAALYGEETHEPTRAIPAATYASVSLIGVFYLLTAWLAVGAMGADKAQAMARAQGGELMLGLSAKFLGEAAGAATGVLVCTSILASYLAMHNAASRYLFALGREKLLPEPLGRFHLARHAPANASLTISALTAASLVVFGLARLDPYKATMPVLIGFSTLGIIILQALAAIAIVVWLARRTGQGGPARLAAPVAGALGLIAATVLVTWNFPLLLSPLTVAWIAWLPAGFAAIFVAGIVFGLWLRAKRPRTYAALGAIELRADTARPRPKPVAARGRYCIVGAGPGGLLAARAMRLAGLPYDQFERHGDVGGIWDIENAGTSMYESAHFISSKHTSGFFGLPMPAHYPDYPDHRQILAYVRQFAEVFGLREAITFNTAVDRAEPLGENAAGGWRVRLSNGETRDYEGLICANGVTWHPNLPTYPGLETFEGEARHSVTHRSADDFRGRRVLIVGAGNSGVDIACDAARAADAAFLSVRRGYRFVPKHVFGVPTDLFLTGAVRPPKGVALPTDPSEMVDALTGDLTRYGLPAPDHKVLESHPILNSQILHHLAHGDITAKGDVRAFTRAGAVFADGSEEAFDLVIFATGYEYRLPFLDEGLLSWNAGHPQLYLNIFHRTLRGLAVLGFVEFASAGYQRFDEMAQMAAMDAWIEQSGAGLAQWRAMKAGDHPNLRGHIAYIDSPRHANYVDAEIYRRVLSDIRERFGWVDPDHGTYDTSQR